MRWKGLPRVGRRTISVPVVPSMTDPDRPPQAREPAGDSDRQPPIDRTAVQYLDRVRAIFRPTRSDALAPDLERFIGREDIFRHVGEVDKGPHGTQAMMQCPPYWPDGVTWVPIADLEILEILEDQDVRAGWAMIGKRRPSGAGGRVKVGRRLIAVPGVPSLTPSEPAAPETKPRDGALEKPKDELSEELTRTVKAAYQ